MSEPGRKYKQLSQALKPNEKAAVISWTSFWLSCLLDSLLEQKRKGTVKYNKVKYKSPKHTHSLCGANLSNVEYQPDILMQPILHSILERSSVHLFRQTGEHFISTVCRNTPRKQPTV